MKKSIWFAVVLVVICGQTGFARTNIGLKGIGPRAGFVDPDHGDGAISLGVVADMGTWTENLPWEMALTWWTAGEDRGAHEWRYTDLAYRNSVYYTFEVGRKLYVYPGAGLAVHFLSFSADGPRNYEYDDSDTELSLMILGGFQFPIANRWRGQTELQLDFGDAEQTNVQIDFIYDLGK